MDNQREKKIGKVFRRLSQIAGFLIMPGLFTSTFFGIRDLVVAMVSRDFQMQELFPQLILVIVMTIGAILFGRVFCGYLCSFGAMADLLWFVARKVHRKYHRIPKQLDRILKWVKYLVLALLFLGVWVFALISYDAMNSPWTIFGMFTTIGNFPSLSYLISVGGLLLLAIIIASLFVERFFCRYLCPLGAYLSMISSLRFFFIKKPRENCKGCSLCSQNCPMGLPLGEFDQVQSGECINCNVCTNVCPKKNAQPNLNGKLVYPFAVVLILGLCFGGPILAKQMIGSSESTNAPSTKGIYTDGTYEGNGTGFHGEIRVSVVVKNGNIAEINVLSHQEDEEYFQKAYQKVVSAMIDQQTTQVDGASGATFSSNGITAAVADALKDVTSQKNTVDDATTNETTTDDSTADDSTPDDVTTDAILNGTYTDGTYEGSGSGFKGTITVQVIIESGKISKINLVSQEDDEPFFDRAWNTVSNNILTSQTPEVDGASGATYSSNGIMEAVANALSIDFTNPTSGGGNSHKGNRP